MLNKKELEALERLENELEIHKELFEEPYDQPSSLRDIETVLGVLRKLETKVKRKATRDAIRGVQ